MVRLRIPEELVKLGKERMKNQQVEGFVYGSGPKNPKLMLVGEAPGETEIHNGIPFSGRAGKKLMEFLSGVGLKREDVYITSAVRSRPYKWKEKRDKLGAIEMKKYNRAPTANEILAHAPILDYEIQNIQPPLIVTLGNVGLQRLIGKQMKVTEMHGRVIEQPILQANEDNEYVWSVHTYRLFPTFHPASVFYNPKLRELVEKDRLALKEWLNKNRPI